MGKAVFRGDPALPSTPYTLGRRLGSEKWPKTTLHHTETEPEAKAKVKNREAAALQGAGPGQPSWGLQTHQDKRHLLLGRP